MRAIITGASRGIGRGLALRLAVERAHIILHGRDSEALKETEAMVVDRGGTADIFVADLSIRKDTIALAEFAITEPVDLLVNNAAWVNVAYLNEITEESWDRILEINVTAPFILTQRIAPSMPKGGTIINICSTGSLAGYKRWSEYCMTKFALDGFAKSIREELRQQGVRVVNVYPGAVATDSWKDVPADPDLSLMMTAENIAETIWFAVRQPDGVLVEDITVTNMNGVR